MRKPMAVLTAVLLALLLTACRNDGAESNSQAGSSPSSSMVGEGSTQSNVNAAPSAARTTGNSSSTPNASSSVNVSSSVNSSQTPNASSPANSSSTTGYSSATSTPTPTTVNGEITNYTICYHADNNVLKTSFDTYYWKMPYGREDDGTLTRDGYVLLGYSYDKSGKGELIRPGYKYTLRTKSDEQALYCVWAKETNAADFKVTQTSSTTVRITAYKGSDKVVYIPRKINGKIVAGIASGAFANNQTLTEVHITSSVVEVEEMAFASCPNLKTVTLYDSLKTISNKSFSGSPVKTVRMCAGKTPRYAMSKETYGMKYERLIRTSGQKRIIVVAGSSALYGIDSDYMESLFKNDYTVINFGTNGNMNLLFYLDAILPHLTKNDIVIYAPEQYGPYSYHTNGNPELPSVTLQGVSTCYNLFENVDISTYTNVFDGIGQYCSESAKMPELSWQDYSISIDQYGDLAYLSDGMNSPYFCFGANGPFRFNETVIPAEFIPNLNRVIDKASKTGAKILFSYPPHNKNNVEKSSLDEESYDFYNKWIAKTVHCPLISDVRNYIYSGEYFANTDYHLNAVGRELHTKQLAKDIVAANIGVK